MKEKKKRENSWHQLENPLWGHQFTLCLYLTHVVRGQGNRLSLIFPEVSWHSSQAETVL